MSGNLAFVLIVTVIITGLTVANVFGPMALPPGARLQCEVITPR
jgi:hypothetical protein